MHKRTLVTLILLVVVSGAAFAANVRVKSGGTPLMASESRTGKPILMLKAGAFLEVIKPAGEWVRVRDLDSKQEGFVVAADVEPSPTSGSLAKPAAKAKRPVGPGDWTDYGYLTVNGMYQAGASSFSDTFTFTQYQEKASVTTSYPLKNTAGFDVAGGARVWRNLAVQLGVSTFSQTSAGTLTGTLPHPFFFNTNRSVSGTVDSLQHQETTVAVQAAWVIPVGRKMLLTLAGGPAFFSVKQSLVQNIASSESYPYDTATFTSATTAQVSASVTGIAVGADIAYYLTRNIGVGGTVNIARGSVALAGPGGNVSMDVGGFRVGGGLRIRLPKTAPKPTTAPTAAKPRK
jgi:hypothetical protein